MLQELFEFERRISAWLRPTYRGALFIFGMAIGWAGKLFILSILATLMLLTGVERGIGLFLELLGVAVGAGAVAGTVHGILHPLEQDGQLGTWVRWTCSVLTYLVTVAFLTPKGPLSLDPTFIPFAAAVSAIAAACLILLDDRKPTRPSLRRFRLLQSRKRMWAAAGRVRARLRKAPLGGPATLRTDQGG